MKKWVYSFGLFSTEPRSCKLRESFDHYSSWSDFTTVIASAQDLMQHVSSVTQSSTIVKSVYVHIIYERCYQHKHFFQIDIAILSKQLKQLYNRLATHVSPYGRTARKSYKAICDSDMTSDINRICGEFAN